MHNNDLFVTSLRVKGQINEPKQIFVPQLAGLICYNLWRGRITTYMNHNLRGVAVMWFGVKRQ